MMDDLLSQDADDDVSGMVFRDVITLVLMGFVAIVIMLLPHLNPPGLDEQEEAEQPGNLLIDLRWPDDQCSDVDLWVQAPGQRAVGYSNKGGPVFNLLRDDLGCFIGDTLNMETAYSRGYPAGEYTVNAHLYRAKSTLPITVTLTIGIKRSASESSKAIITTTAELDREAQELTIIRFSLDSDGNLVPGSVHHLQRNLRASRGDR